MIISAIPARDHPFHRFMFQLIQNKNAQEAIEKLRKQSRSNPNLFLYSIWFAYAAYGRLQKIYFKNLLNAIYPWHDFISIPLTNLFNSILHSKKSLQWEGVLKSIAAEILECESVEREFLANVLVPKKKLLRTDWQKCLDACFNLANYCKLMKLHLTESYRDYLVTLLQLAFDKLSLLEINHALKMTFAQLRVDETSVSQLHLMDI
jgi:hypothetical protein